LISSTERGLMKTVTLDDEEWCVVLEELGNAIETILDDPEEESKNELIWLENVQSKIKEQLQSSPLQKSGGTLE
ncbi:MAG: hypothetical protein K0U52_12585, partial [Gammaproteobacteria bacterium]|nr:hypothetical protein [Gammaproteobacteria bacterium]